MMRTRRFRHSSRRGYSLVLFVLFLMSMLALAALIIDLGLVRLTSFQMQSMTDSAALELQRELDPSEVWEAPVAMQGELEAGPTLKFEQPGTLLVGDFRAHPELGATSTGKWMPTIQPPMGNLSDDVVIGNYSLEIADHSETNDYQRTDFTSNADENDVLVRLRRTGTEAGLGAGGSTGPPVPFFFGRGLLMGGGSTAFWNHIQRGAHVRKTSIAKRSSAMSAGPYVQGDAVNMIGLINVEIDLAIWQANETISAANYSTFDDALLSFRTLGDPAMSYNDDPIMTTTPERYPTNSGYVAITSQLSGAFNNNVVVVGFGLVEVNTADDALTRISSRRGFENTSSTPHRQHTSEQWSELLAINNSLFENHHGIAAPALVRSEQ